MPEICVLYVSEDDSIVKRLVGILNNRWSSWWAGEITHGRWEPQVRKNIRDATAVIPVFSANATEDRTAIIRDEMGYAQRYGRPILPFIIQNGADIPFGFDGLNRTDAIGWTGNEADPQFQKLIAKLAQIINPSTTDGGFSRLKQLTVGPKVLPLPSFVFSVSSFETQIMPNLGIKLLYDLNVGAALISAYDLWKLYSRDKQIRSDISSFKKSPQTLLLDSGGYEAARRNDLHNSRRNPTGWRREEYWQIAATTSPDVAFSSDALSPEDDVSAVIGFTVRRFLADDKALQNRSFPLCPIVHLPATNRKAIDTYASAIVAGIAEELKPIAIAVPERELGDGLLSRVRAVVAIRRALDKLGWYCPLHLLGTGNPLSMAAFSSAGADSFDGLEWCRTVVDYATGYLFHFQQFDCFSESRLNRIQDPEIRQIVESAALPFSLRTLSYNVDYFKDMSETMRKLIHSGQAKILLNQIPDIGGKLQKMVAQ